MLQGNFEIKQITGNVQAVFSKCPKAELPGTFFIKQDQISR